MRAALGVLLLVACSQDAEIEAARKRVLALDAATAGKIVAFCASHRTDTSLRVTQLPTLFPIHPTTVVVGEGTVTFEWWNNDHRDEDQVHPGFELVCADAVGTGARAIAPGLWYRDAPMTKD